MPVTIKQIAIYSRLAHGGVHLKFSSNLLASLRSRFGDVGSYPIVFCPREAKKAVIIGMFVLRPAYHAWNSAVLSDDQNYLDQQLYRVQDWAYNYQGFDGGWLIADRSPYDAFRVALQYGCSDAVIVGTSTVCAEGIDTVLREGYTWQPYFMTELEQLKTSFPEALPLITEQRLKLQEEGYLSSRPYPAVIIYSKSGEQQGETDFLDARVFAAVHPNGQPIECYIMTGEKGASNIRNRIKELFPHLVDRMESMFLIIPNVGKTEDNTESTGQIDLDLGLVPQILYDRLGIQIANHDGGQGVLREFCKAGAVAQVNLTLCRNRSLKDVLLKYQSQPDIDFDQRTKLFFSSTASTDSIPSGTLPSNWTAVYCVEDGQKDTVVTIFDVRGAGDFYTS